MEEELLKNYQQKRRELEEQEDEIRRVKRKGERIAEDTYSEIRHLLSDYENSNEILNEARRELSHLEEEFMMELSQERKKVINKQDESEQVYRKAIKKLRKGD